MLRHVARALIGAVYVQQGVEQVRHPQAAARSAAGLVSRVARSTPVPDDPVLVARVAGGSLIVGGLGLITSRAPRASAALVAAVAVPAALARHPVRSLSLATLRGPEGSRLLADLGLLGGAVLAALDTAGRPGLAWRARKGSERAAAITRRGARRARRTARLQVRLAKRDAQLAQVRAVTQARRSAKGVAARVGEAAQSVPSLPSLPGLAA